LPKDEAQDDQGERQHRQTASHPNQEIVGNDKNSNLYHLKPTEKKSWRSTAGLCQQLLEKKEILDCEKLNVNEKISEVDTLSKTLKTKINVSIEEKNTVSNRKTQIEQNLLFNNKQIIDEKNNNLNFNINTELIMNENYLLISNSILILLNINEYCQISINSFILASDFIFTLFK
jgi:sucrose-6-phosphate hydrolase SacC (GH32 family)